MASIASHYSMYTMKPTAELWNQNQIRALHLVLIVLYHNLSSYSFEHNSISSSHVLDYTQKICQDVRDSELQCQALLLQN